MNDVIDEQEDSTHAKTPVLIDHYGEYWDASVFQANDWRLEGTLSRRPAEKRRKDTEPLDHSELVGVYILFKDFEPAYVGRTEGQNFSNRLRAHRQSMYKGRRWDTFSWFSVSKETNVPREVVIASLEAVLILAMNPHLNRRHEKFKGATRWYQETPKTTVPSTDDRLTAIEQKLDEILDRKRS